MTPHLLMERTIEKSRTGCVNWPANVVWRARGGNYCTLRPVTSGEPIISSVEAVSAASVKPLAARLMR
jgi:hypothetical protein